MSLWQGNIAEAVALRHTQGTDLGLDTGGANPVAASELQYAKAMNQEVAVASNVEFAQVSVANALLQDENLFIQKSGLGGAGGSYIADMGWRGRMAGGNMEGLYMTSHWPKNATCVITNGSAVVTMDSTAELSTGLGVYGAGIPDETIVLSIDSETQITMDKNATADTDPVTLIFKSDIFVEGITDDLANYAYIGFNGLTNQIEIAMQDNLMVMKETEIVFNASSEDVDAIFNGDTKEVLRVNAGADSIQIPDDVKLNFGNSDDVYFYWDHAGGEYFTIVAQNWYMHAGAWAQYVGFMETSHGVFSIQQTLTDFAAPCLVLGQVDVSEGFINLVGSERGVITGVTNSTQSARIELNGTIYRIALYADA